MLRTPQGTGRKMGLFAIAVCELVVGLGLRNEALAARARSEVDRRQLLQFEQQNLELQGLYAALTSTEAVLYRIAYQRDLQKVQEQQRRPEL